MRNILRYSVAAIVVGIASFTLGFFARETIPQFLMEAATISRVPPPTAALFRHGFRTIGSTTLQESRKELNAYLIPSIDVRVDTFNPSEKYFASLSEPDRTKARRVFDLAKDLSVISGAFKPIHGWRWRSFYLQNGAKRLLVVHGGHFYAPMPEQVNVANPFEWGLIEKALSDGYDVIVMAMPGEDWNAMDQVDVSTWDGEGRLIKPSHNALEIVDTGDKHFIGFFVSPVIASIDKALAAHRYSSIKMVGLSGGGWTAVISAAADYRIDTTISVAGTLPFFAREQQQDLGDAEQFDTSFYQRFPWPTLYQLATFPSRRLFLRYNTDDPCCFDKNSASIFANYAVGAPYTVSIIERDQHSFSPDRLLHLLDEPTATPTTGVVRR